jgi:hypothetical protein
MVVAIRDFSLDSIRYEAQRGLAVHLNRAAYHAVQYMIAVPLGGVYRILTVRTHAIQMPQGSAA